MEQFKNIANLELLNIAVAGNTIGEWLLAIGVFLVMFFALELARNIFVHRLMKLAKKTNSRFDDVLASLVNSVKWPIFILVALFFALKGVQVPESLTLILNIALLVIIVYQVIRVTEEIFAMLMLKQLQKNDPQAVLPGVFRIAVRMLLWSVGGLMILSNAGVDITSLVAGLGIGGLAISLALQNILSDLFSSFSIAVDKPFTIGDYIMVGDHDGVVKHIGLKTTRITALSGEEIVISNAELTSARVQNYRKMKERRVVMHVGVTYDTPREKLDKINKILEEAVSAQGHLKFDRSHFHEFGNSALIFEVVYFVDTRDYAMFMEAKQGINFAVVDAFEKEGIEMAFPTQTLYIKKEE